MPQKPLSIWDLPKISLLTSIISIDLNSNTFYLVLWIFRWLVCDKVREIIITKSDPTPSKNDPRSRCQSEYICKFIKHPALIFIRTHTQQYNPLFTVRTKWHPHRKKNWLRSIRKLYLFPHSHSHTHTNYASKYEFLYTQILLLVSIKKDDVGSFEK